MILSNGSILDESIGSISGQNTMLAVNGSLTLGTSGTLNILPAGPLQSGTYTLATAGSISGAGNLSGWTITGLPAAPVLSISGGTLSLSYTAVPISGIGTPPSAAVGAPSPIGRAGGSRTSPGIRPPSVPRRRQQRGRPSPWTAAIRSSALSFSTTGGGSYTITTSSGDTTSALTLSNGGLGGTATVTNSGGNQTIAAPIILGSNLAVSVALGSSLTFSGPISESSTGTNLTVSGSGSGVVIFSGTNSYSGSTTVSSGTLRR